MFDVLDAAEKWFRNNRDSFIAEGFEVHFSRTADTAGSHMVVGRLSEADDVISGAGHGRQITF